MHSVLERAFSPAKISTFGKAGGGCISKGDGWLIEGIGPVFVKHNEKSGAKEMLLGEFYGLKEIEATGCIKVPKPIKVLDLPDGGAALVMEYVDMGHLDRSSSQLGERLARLHLHNREKRGAAGDASGYVGKFGFHVTTCCGYLPQDNTWNDDWVDFYTNSRLQLQIDRATENERNPSLLHKWNELKPRIRDFFYGIDVFPSLIHGDLWSGNAAEVKETREPIIFDPAVAYCHHEFDLSIAAMFGGFSKEFYAAYHRLIPKTPGFDNRQKLYQLYHYLNHYNHFGGGYLHSSLRLMDEIIHTKS